MAKDKGMSDKEIGDLYAVVTAVVWDNMTPQGKKIVHQEMSPNERNDVALAIRHGRQVKAANKQKAEDKRNGK